MAAQTPLAPSIKGALISALSRKTNHQARKMSYVWNTNNTKINKGIKNCIVRVSPVTPESLVSLKRGSETVLLLSMFWKNFGLHLSVHVYLILSCGKDWGTRDIVLMHLELQPQSSFVHIVGNIIPQIPQQQSLTVYRNRGLLDKGSVSCKPPGPCLTNQRRQWRWALTDCAVVLAAFSSSSG